MVIDYRQVVVRAGALTAIMGIVLLFAYILVGHPIIETIYRSDISIFGRLLPGKAFTPLEAYLASFDTGVLRLAILFAVAGLLVCALGKDPLGPILAGCSLFTFSFLLFSFLEAFPSFIRPLRLDIVPYYAFRLTFIPDPVLGFREKPLHRAEITNFRGWGYSPLYGIEVPPSQITWVTDKEGFRNEPDVTTADIVVIGSSYVEYGYELDDTFPKRLESHLGGLRVLNLGKAGYGPLQYVDVLRIYGLKKKPKYALLVLYPPADTDSHLATWVESGEQFTEGRRNVAFRGFFSRYRVAMQQMNRLLLSAASTGVQLAFRKIMGSQFIHPDVAVLRLPNDATSEVVFVDQHSTKSVEELLSSPEWAELERIIANFKKVSLENHIVPLLVFVPAATEIYAKYSTSESGANWRHVVESQIATSTNNEEALKKVSQKIGVELISLRPEFQRAAAQGKLIYYPLDSHWNAEGREIAAQVTAEALKDFIRAQARNGEKEFIRIQGLDR